MATAPSRTVLIVDDDQSTLDLQRRILEAAGFIVIEASDGTEALAVLKGDTALTLVVSDVEMPGLSGDDLAREVSGIRPGLKVLFVTGNVDRLFEKEWFMYDDRAYLSKPFTGPELVESVLALIGAARP
jgi:two-component system cell cycle sensor histidine kinase/response regulator CckA